MCQKTKPLDDFHRQPSGPLGRHSYCKLCANQKQRESRVRNYSPEQKRKWQVKTRYGITPAIVQSMLADQNGCCAICAVNLIKFHIDHSHETGKVRGLLCHRCNIRLGGWDDPEWRDAAMKYMGFR